MRAIRVLLDTAVTDTSARRTDCGGGFELPGYARVMDVSELVERLIHLHGEGGVAPTADEWRAILQQPEAAPVTLLNLLQFKAEVATARGAISGRKAYDAYSNEVAPAFARVGAELLFRGRVAQVFSTTQCSDWHLAVLTKYPTPRALAEFWLDPEFVRAHAHRVDGVQQSMVLVFT